MNCPVKRAFDCVSYIGFYSVSNNRLYWDFAIVLSNSAIFTIMIVTLQIS